MTGVRTISLAIMAALATIAIAEAQQAGDLSNPLWSLQLESLAATRDRPLFTQGRRPPALATAQPASENPQTAILSPPPFALIGTVVGDGEKIALVMENATQKVLRLPVGEIASGWSVADVASRSVTLKRGAEVVTLELPKPLLR